MHSIQNNKTKQPPITLYLLAGLIPFSAYAFYHLTAGIFQLGIATLINALLFGLVLLHNCFKPSKRWHNHVLVFSMSMMVIIGCNYVGIRGLAFMFPVIVALFFNYSLRRAMVSSVVFSVIGLIVATNSIDPLIVARISIPVALTIAFSFLYAKTIKQHKYALKQEAALDYLTGIFNRRSISKWVETKVSHIQNNTLALYFIDVDDFKRINDSYGHAVGDQLLTTISQRLQNAVHHSVPGFLNIDCKVARLAGDEFLVAIADIKRKNDVEIYGDKLLKSINKPVVIDGISIDVHTSIGVAATQDSDIEPAALLNHADVAMFEAKKKGKNRIGYFNKDLADKLQEKNAIAQRVKNSLEQKHFYLTFMPIFEEATSGIIGAEALIRNDHESFNGITPDKYIQVAEEYGLIIDIDLYVIEACFSHLQDIQPALLKQKFTLAINISSLELKNKQFPAQVEKLVKQYNIPTSLIELEITETSLVDYNEDSIALLNQLKSLGFSLSLDDFGTGYTAFNQLQHYPVDTLKIDRSFVWAIGESNNNKGFMIDVILSLAKLYKLSVVAEGVEEQHQLEYLQALGCSHYQGYLLSKPLSWQELKALINT